MRGSSAGGPNWHQPRQSSPSKTSAACVVPCLTRSSFRSRFSAGDCRSGPSAWKPMHQQPPNTPLFASTSAANASHVLSSSALIVNAVSANDRHEVEEGEHALGEEGGRVGVVRRERRVGEEMLLAGVEEEFRVVG